MKVCYLADARSVHTQRWIKYFAERGHEIHIITFEPYQFNEKNITVHTIKKGRYIPFFNLFRQILQIRNLIKKINPDIVHGHYATSYGKFLPFIGNYPKILSVWGSDVLIAPQKSFLTRQVLGFTLRRVDVITTTAEFMGEYLQKKFGVSNEKIIRIPWGTNLNIFYRDYKKEIETLEKNLRIKKGSTIVISNRHMTPKYNIQSIIEAASHVLKMYPNIIFIFIRGYGFPEFEDKMKLKAKKLGIINNIRFISKVITPHEMAIYLNMADMFVSIPKTDQFGSSVIEGMACGTIPIVSNIEVYRQYLKDGENSFLVDPENPKEISKNIAYYIEHPELKEKFYKINKKIVEENENWEKKAREMEELYEKLYKIKNKIMFIR